MSIRFTPQLAAHYREMFENCQVLPSPARELPRVHTRLLKGRARYAAVAAPFGMPWHVPGVLHAMESSFNWCTHLHNGDPLTARTVHVPAGRPRAGCPPFTWEESAVDALLYYRLDTWRDWSVAGTLYVFERYNGWGYRLYHPQVPSPYLWSWSSYYRSGKYTSDGKFDPNAVSKQCGAAILLKSILG